ncbi:glycosyltransferase [Cohnella sp. CFH 77786]|uniref:glycosyltransferase family 2 protein n=1 Tax=Cohnella sp. CFH 77786 TaxID=2662265 RepID=UPI001C61113F|nr:glycosyltransferase family 2 protein [Cohnella sp. CFH 77786]MBW5448472.1 glycosyltransferase [Cohnella sp. CFH 77786]
MKISVCMIVKDEEMNLPRALQSVPKEYEVIVADTGSTDRTMEVAARFGAKIVSMDWEDDFAIARNIAASHATGDYILSLDADEELPDDTDAHLRRFTGQFPRKAGCVTILNRMGNEVKKHRMVRFYPNLPDFSYHGFVHEQVYENGEPAAFESIPLHISHYGYEPDEYLNKQKAERYRPMYEKHLAAHPNDGYMLYQFGKLYYGLSEYEMAERYLRASLVQGQINRLYFPVLLVMLGYVLKEQNRHAEAEGLLRPYLPVFSDFPDLPFLLGLLAMDNGNLSDVETYFTDALKIGDTEKYSSVYGVGTFLAAYNLGVYYEVTGNRDLAEQCYRFAGQYDYEPALRRLK